jgi:hypothetical protein
MQLRRDVSRLAKNVRAELSRLLCGQDLLDSIPSADYIFGQETFMAPGFVKFILTNC